MCVDPDVCMDMDFPSPKEFGEAEVQPTPDCDAIICSGGLKVGGQLYRTTRHVPMHFGDHGVVKGLQKASGN